jgi:hypothetical protein
MGDSRTAKTIVITEIVRSGSRRAQEIRGSDSEFRPFLFPPLDLLLSSLAFKSERHYDLEKAISLALVL